MTYSSFPQATGDIDPREVVSMVISAPLPAAAPYKKIRAERGEAGFFVACHTATQVFHKTLSPDELLPFCAQTLPGRYRQVTFWLRDGRVLDLLLSKKGHVHRSVHREQPPQTPAGRPHNRQKNRLIREGMIVPPLVDMGVMTPDGRVVKARYDKFRQINRFLEILDDEFRGADEEARSGDGGQEPAPLRIVDFGCGKAYLTFVVYYYFTELKKRPVEILGLDLKESVMEKCNAAAQKYGYRRLRFEVGNIRDYCPPGDVDLVMTLHACDTATDYALYNAVKWNARTIFSVPCCQHELNRQLQPAQLKLLARYGIVQERFSALLTDAIRANLLECCGYETQLLEFIDLEHTPKNLMIRAVKRARIPLVQARQRARCLEEVQTAMREFGVTPTLYTLLIGPEQA